MLYFSVLGMLKYRVSQKKVYNKIVRLWTLFGIKSGKSVQNGPRRPKKVQICVMCPKLSRAVQNTKKSPKPKNFIVHFFLGHPEDRKIYVSVVGQLTNIQIAFYIG